MARTSSSQPTSPVTARVRGYALALALTLAGWAVTTASVRLLQGPFFTFQFAAVVGAALYGGLGPGLLTAVLSATAFGLMYFPPVLEAHEVWRVGSFLVISAFFAWIAAKVRRAKNDALEAKARAEAAELEARTVGAQQERLVAVVSHDLRSPLSAIALSAEAIRAGAAPDGQARALGRIKDSVGRMQALIVDLLDYARARHASGLPVHTRTARLAEIARRAVEEARAATPDGAVELEVDGDDAASLDPARVEQLVSNLVSNALKHRCAGTPVTVRITGAPDAVRLEVSNHGEPVPPQLLPTLFDPFRPGDAPGSVGLGLFIVREIARGHGGNVSARSDRQGTTFTAVFPRTAPATSG